MNEISVTKKADYEVLAWAKYITFTYKDNWLIPTEGEMK